MALAPPTSLPALFRLPPELRQQIYAHLLPREPISHPLPGTGITSITHPLPTAALLTIHPLLTTDLLAHFYTTTTFKLTPPHAFNFFRTDPDLRRLAQSPLLPHIRNLEITFFTDILLLPHTHSPAFNLTHFCREIRLAAARVCDVLARAHRLRRVTVSWIDTTLTGGWGEKATTLQPLRQLAEEREVAFRIGEINGPEGEDRAAFIAAIEGVLGEGGKLDSAVEGAAADGGAGPSELRLLAFDVRQDREVAREVARMRSRGGQGEARIRGF
ncbi:hypothetical protein LTR08_006908 [Meristemomyces frigidus]|nr:hypothetical protein LTR08_006908 [Meristemomyces frigidus]